MAGKKKIVEGVVTQEDPAIIAGDPETPSLNELSDDDSILVVNMPKKVVDQLISVKQIPTSDISETLELLTALYSRSNNREFRLKAKRLQASLTEFVNKVNEMKNG